MITFKELARKGKDIYKSHRLVINLAVLFLILLFCCFWHWPSYLALVYLTIIVLTEKNYKGFYYLVFSVPFITVVVIGTYGYVIPIVIAIYAIFNYIKAFIVEKAKLSKVSLVFLILLEVYCALPLNPYSLLTFLKMGIFLIAFMILELLREKGRCLSFKTIIYSFFLGFTASSLCAFLEPFSEIIQSVILNFDYGGYKRFCGLFPYPAFYSLLCAVALAFLLYLVFNHKYKILNVCFCILTSVFGFLTMSKNFIILFCIILVFTSIKLFTMDYKKALLILGILLAIFSLIYLCFSDFVTALLNRFVSATHLEDISGFDWSEILTFRNDIWGHYLTLIFQDMHILFFGAGLGGSLTINPHNTYICVWYQMGLIGFVLVFFMFLYGVYQICKNVSLHYKLDWFATISLVLLAMYLFAESP